MGPRLRRALLIVVGLGALAFVPIAHGGREPTARIACATGAAACQEAGKASAPAHGTAEQLTDVVPTKSKKGTEWVTPFSKRDLTEFDSMWETIAEGFPKLGGIKNVFVKRLLTCAVFSVSFTDFAGVYAASKTGSATAKRTDTSQLFLTLCLQMVLASQRQPTGPAADASSSGCSQALVTIPIEIKRSGGGYVAKFDAKPRRPTRPTSLAVTCRPKGSGILIGMHPRSPSRYLHQVIGSQMAVGFSNASAKSVGIHTTFTFTG